MKRAALAILILFVALAILPAGAAPARALEAGIYAVLLDNTPVYAEPNTASAILVTLTKDSQITVTGTQTANNLTWCVVSVNSRTGYMRAAAVYQKHAAASYTVQRARISADKKGSDIFIYTSPSEDAQKLYELNDGVRVTLTGYEANGFLEVLYRGDRGFVRSDNIVTGGFTYHQYLAFLVGVVCIAAVVVIIALTRINHKKKTE